MFTLMPNVVTGKGEWRVAEPPMKKSGPIETFKSATYTGMLNDVERNDSYESALKDALAGGDKTVCDVGSGSGLLSLLALRHGARKVLAFEQSRDVADICRRTLSVNNDGSHVTCFNEHSTETSLEDKADVLVMEVFDSELLGEGILRTATHAKAELLQASPIIIPRGATIKGQLVHCGELTKMVDLHRIGLASRGGEMQMLLLCADSRSVKPLSKPFEIFNFDFLSSPIPIERSLAFDVRVEETAYCNAVVVWFELQMSLTATLSTKPAYLRTGPAQVPFRDHWKQCIYIQTEGVHVDDEESIRVIAKHNESSVKLQLKHGQSTDNPQRQLPAEDNDYEQSLTVFGRDRIWMLNSGFYHEVLHILSKIRSGIVFDIGDASLLSVLYKVDRHGEHKYVSFEGIDANCKCVDKLCKASKDTSTTCLPHAAEDITDDHIEKLVSSCETKAQQVCVIASDGYFSAFEGLPRWYSVLRQWHATSSFRTKLARLSLTPQLLLSRGRVMAATISSPELFECRKPAPFPCGFDHSFIYESALPPANVHMWMYPHDISSDVHALLDVDMNIDPYDLEENFSITCTSQSHALCIWADFIFLGQELTYSSKPRCTPSPGKQTILVFDSPVPPGSSLDVTISHDSRSGLLNILYRNISRQPPDM